MSKFSCQRTREWLRAGVARWDGASRRQLFVDVAEQVAITYRCPIVPTDARLIERAECEVHERKATDTARSTLTLIRGGRA